MHTFQSIGGALIRAGQPNLDATSRVVARACAASALGLGVLAYSQGRWTGYYLELLFASSVPGDVAEYRVTTPGTPLLTFILRSYEPNSM